MQANCYLKPAWSRNGSIRTDLPLMVVQKARKREIRKIIQPGQLFCVGKVYLKMHNRVVRIK